MKVWLTNYKNHEVRVENRVFSERLFVDGELQDEQIGYGLRSRLFGKIRDGDAAGYCVKVSLGGWLTIQCRVFIDDALVFSSSK